MDLIKAIGTVLLFFLLFSPAFYCASKLDGAVEDRAGKLGCADGQKAYLSPLSNQPIYKECN